MRRNDFLAGLALVAGLAPLVLLLANCSPYMTLNGQVGRDLKAAQVDGQRALDIRTLKQAGCDQARAIAQTMLTGVSQAQAQARIATAVNFAAAECPTITGKVAGE
jgi:hypothetical protein